MPHLERTLDIAAEPAAVWAVVADPGRFGEWLTLHESWSGPVPDEFAAGARVTANLTLLGLPMTITWTVDEYSPPRTVRLSGRGLAGVQVAIAATVTPHGSGARFTLAVDVTGTLLAGPIGQAVEDAGTIELDNSLARLRTLID